MDPLNLFLELTNICRLCLSQDRHLEKIFPDTDQNKETLISISSKIIACVGIQLENPALWQVKCKKNKREQPYFSPGSQPTRYMSVQEVLAVCKQTRLKLNAVQDDDNFPDKICERCIKEIENWTQFKQICDNANTLLLQSVAGLSPLQNQILQNNLNVCHGENLDILSTPSVFEERLALEAESFFQKIDEKHLPSLLSADSLSSVFIEGDNVDQNETITLYRGEAEHSAVQTPTPEMKEVEEVENRPETSVSMNLDLSKGLIVREPEVGMEDIMVVTKLEEPENSMEDINMVTEPEILFKDKSNPKQPTGINIKIHVLQESDMNVERSKDMVKDLSQNLHNRQELPEQSSGGSRELYGKSLNLLREKCSFEHDTPDQLVKGPKENRRKESLDPKVEIQREKWMEKYDKFYKRTYACGFCPRVFSKFTDLLKHDKIEHSAATAEYKCDKCGNCFISKGRLDFHFMMRHREKVFVCTHCNFKSVSKKSLTIHIQCTHIKQYSLDPCHICGGRFRSKSNLLNHIKLHESPKFSCEICARVFKQSQSLTRHYNTFHSKHKSFECAICLKHFKSFENMQVHKKSHNPTITAVCDICGLNYKNERTLSIHKKTHEEKKHCCHVCSKSFTTRHLLNRHINIHSKSRPYICKVCDKWFNRADVLKDHLLVHCEELKLFKCGSCELTFRLKRYLNTHINTIHKKDDGLLQHN